jgi:hypothetical protein
MEFLLRKILCAEGTNGDQYWMVIMILPHTFAKYSQQVLIPFTIDNPSLFRIEQIYRSLFLRRFMERQYLQNRKQDEMQLLVYYLWESLRTQRYVHDIDCYVHEEGIGV